MASHRGEKVEESATTQEGCRAAGVRQEDHPALPQVFSAYTAPQPHGIRTRAKWPSPSTALLWR